MSVPPDDMQAQGGPSLLSREARKEWISEWYLTPESDKEVVKLVVSRNCACNRDILVSELSHGIGELAKDGGLFRRSSHDSVNDVPIDTFHSSLNKALKIYGIETCIDKAHFLAHVAVESDMLRTTEEYRNLDGSMPSRWNSYDGGAKYHGRGLIQLTHDHNYRKYSDHVGKDYVENPEPVASNLAIATDSACWYWREGSAWGDMSRRAKDNDFLWTTIGVNGGFNHFNKRKMILGRLAEAFLLRDCEQYGSHAFESFKLSESALSRTNNGPRIWRNFFAADDER